MSFNRMDIYMETLKYDIDHLSDDIKNQLSLLGVDIDEVELHRLPLACFNINNYMSANLLVKENKNNLLLVIRYLINRIIYESNFDDDYAIAFIAMLKSEPVIWELVKPELYQYAMWTGNPYAGYIYYIHFDDCNEYLLNLIITSNKAKLYSRLIRYSYAKKNESDYSIRYNQVVLQIIQHLCNIGHLLDFIEFMNNNNQAKFNGTGKKFAVPISELLEAVPPEYDYMKLGVNI